MSLKDLVTSQPVQEVSTSSEPENVTVNNDEENASATSVNVDGEGNVQSDDDQHPRFQKRINQLSGANKELQEKLLQSEAAMDAIERNIGQFQQPNSEAKLSDLDANQLKDFITKARDNEELQEHIPEAQDLLVEKRIEEGLGRFEEKRNIQDSESQGLDLTNIMLNNMAGEQLQDTDGAFFQNVQSNLFDLQRDEYKHLNKDQVLAVALAKVKVLESQAKGPTLSEKIIKNRSTTNTVMTNNRSANFGGSNLGEILKDNPTLTKNKQGQSGSLNAAIKELGAVKSIQGG